MSKMIDRPSVGETDGLTDGIAYHQARGKITRRVDWTTPGLKLTRLRLLSDPGYPRWDVSYCHGILDGEDVNVLLPFSDLPKKGMRTYLIQEAKNTNCYVDGLMSCISTLC